MYYLWLNEAQAGPYTLQQVQSMWNAGQITALTLFWQEGKAEWEPLGNILSEIEPKKAVFVQDKTTVLPSFEQTIVRKTGQLTGASKAPQAPAATQSISEETLWQGHPSQILNLRGYLIWSIVLIAALSCILISPIVIVVFGFLALVALMQCAVQYFHLRSIEYVVTTQRVRVVSGIFSKDVQEIELFRVKDTAAHQSLFLRLFGLGTITIFSGDERNPRIFLNGIPRAIELRERIRQEVLVLRQRFSVRELDMM